MIYLIHLTEPETFHWPMTLTIDAESETEAKKLALATAKRQHFTAHVVQSVKEKK